MNNQDQTDKAIEEELQLVTNTCQLSGWDGSLHWSQINIERPFNPYFAGNSYG